MYYPFDYEHNNHVYDGNLKQSLCFQWIVHLYINHVYN